MRSRRDSLPGRPKLARPAAWRLLRGLLTFAPPGRRTRIRVAAEKGVTGRDGRLRGQRRCLPRGPTILLGHRNELERVAQELLKKQTLDAQEFNPLIGRVL